MENNFEKKLGHTDRRSFLKKTAVTSLFLAMHDQLIWAAPLSKQFSSTWEGPRIQKLHLKTAVPLKKMKDYYQNVIELPVRQETDDAISVIAGQTEVVFEKAGPLDGEPWYHFAFNIPENKLWKARKWQRERGPTKLRTPGPNVDAKTPDVVHYPKWNAHSVFFWDPAGNLVEYIARHDLNNGASGSFTSKDILYASEIGIMCENVELTATEMKTALQLEKYRQHNNHFYPIGDEYGLLIMFTIGRAWRSNNDGGSKPTTAYHTEVTLRGNQHLTWNSKEYPYGVKYD